MTLLGRNPALSLGTLVVLVLSMVVAFSGSAPAQGGALAPQNCGLAFKDAKGDNNAGSAQDLDANDVHLDILEGWFAYDASKGDKATTANLRVTDMSDRISDGASGVVWNFVFDVDGATRFVRTLVDFSGMYHEYGVYLLAGSEANPAPISRYQYEGSTEGVMVEGPNGGLSLVIPKDIAKPGGTLSEPFATASSSKQAVPGSIPSPSRGLSTPIDTAPDESDAGNGGTSFAVKACGGAPGPGPTTGPTPPPGGTTTQPKPAQHGNDPLPVKVVGKAKAGKKLSVKLKSSEALSKIAAQLRKGTKVLAKGSLAKLSGTGTLKLKASKKVKKGKYLLDVAGKDAKGAHRIVTLKLTVK